MKQQYLAFLREQKTKQYLPRIRTPLEEEQVSAKEQEKEKLDAMVKDMRRIRLEEAEKRQKEQAMAAIPDVSNAENIGRLPPLPQFQGKPIQKGNGEGMPPLPVINTDLTPASPASVPKPIAPGASTSSITSRPVSQDSSSVGITRIKLKDEPTDTPRSTALKRSHSHPNIAQVRCSAIHA